MALMTAAETAALAADVAEVQPDTAAVRRATAASDGMGGITNTWSTVASVSCRVTPADKEQAEQLAGGALRDGMVWKVSMPAGTDVRLRDRLQVGATTYAVEAVRSARSVEVETVAYVSKAVG